MALPPLTHSLSVKPRFSSATALVRAVWVSIPPLLHLGIVGAILFRGFGSAVTLSPISIRVRYLVSYEGHHLHVFTLRSAIAFVLVYS